MIFRATLALLAFALPGSLALAAGAATYDRGENFSTRPDNWTYFHPNQFYGYQAPTHEGGSGSAGGLFLPKTYFNYFADTHLNGTLTRGTTISASGRIHLQRISAVPPYTNTTYICHFSRGTNGYINTIGIALTGYNDSNVVATAILEFSNGSAFIGNSVGLPVATSTPQTDWTYTWDPTGGTQGFGALTVTIGGANGGTSTINLTKTSAGLDFALNSFGLFQPPFVAPNSNTYLEFNISRIAYTALQGNAPKLKVKGPHKIQTSVAKVAIKGTTHTSVGNRVTTVRYRVVKNGNAGSYHKAKGTTNWNAKVKVPTGGSRIEIEATGDNGLTTTVSRDVQRTP
jgi:hypothetical protein